MALGNVLIPLAVGYAVFVIYFGLISLRTRDTARQRLDHYGTRIRTLEELELRRSFGERAIKPTLRSVAKLFMRLMPQLDLDAGRHKLDMAGNPRNLSVTDFVGARVLAGFLGAAIPLGIMLVKGMALPTLLVYPLVTGAIGFYLPVLWLR